ncbi:ATP-binding protein [Larkinella rosea]|uniref:ATP-binding protein n=1 Tax=Larkinella rosea TaxID=2025312 RepID=A0A3P1BPT3_9BACT|nr:ATP-binding protein [Larkinella rosea]RRB02896.1 ATP-binding protein [Larkinella rosea]
MPLLIKKAHDPITVKSIRTLLFGQPGVRKTSYAFTAPRPLLIDCDGGIRRVAPQYREDYIEVSCWEDISQVLNEDIRAYDSLIFDTVSKMLDYAAEYVIRQDGRMKRRDGNLTQQGYGALNVLFKQFVGRVSVMGKNLVFVAHDKENRNGDEVTIRPDIVGSNLGVVIKDMDLVGYMEMYNNISTVAFSPTDRHYGKNTCGLPDRIETGKMPLATIFTTYYAAINQETEDVKRHREQMADVQLLLDSVQTCSGLNDAMETIKKREFLLNGRTVAAQLVSTKAAELACEFDKESKQYVESATPLASAA